MRFDKLIQQSLIWRGFYFVTLFLVNIILSRTLHADGSGLVYYISTFFALAQLIISANLESGFTYFSSGNIIHHNKLALFGLLWSVLATILIALILPAYFNHFEKINSISVNSYVLYGVCFMGGITLVNFFTVLFYSKGNFFLPNLSLGILNILFLVIVWMVNSAGVPASAIMHYYFYFLLFQGVVLAIIFIITNKTYKAISLPDKNELNQLFRYSMVALAANIVFFFIYRIDFWFVRYNCPANDLGNYIQASKLGQMIFIIPQIIASAIFPQIASGKLHEDVSRAIVILFRLFIQVFILLILVVLLTGRWLFPFIFGETFNKVQVPLLLLLPGILSLSLLCLLSAYFAGKNKVKVNMIGACIGLAVVIAGNTIGLKHYSIYIAAGVSTLGYFTNFLYSLIRFVKDEKFNAKEIYRWNMNDWQWLRNMIFNK